ISDRIIKKEFEDTALSVKDYGAVGDGIHDDRQAIQDAIDAAAQGLGGGNVYFPEGTYLVKEIVFLKSHTHLELNEKATILNGINIKNHPSIVFMTGLFTDDGAQVEWGPTEDISYSGGTIDMNGALNEEGTKAKNLPLINSSGAFAIGNSNNVTIKNVTFKDSYQGHAIQIAGSKNVLVDNSRFLGQALPKTMKDGQIISKESIQIEPLTRKGFPYALNDDGKKSENVTIQNSYFGKSDKSGELVTAIGTHYQTLSTQNPSNIKILNNHFDNMMYAGVRFTGFTDVLIKGNRFDKKVKGESVH
ncbi:multi-ligand-binding adhesin PfbA, partial [Streptococcus pneumoniae]|nr:multi-ligand-binding adhesin PfbA [Streptococcus pneumoniae]